MVQTVETEANVIWGRFMDREGWFVAGTEDCESKAREVMNRLSALRNDITYILKPEGKTPFHDPQLT